jgi:hypothetical protein
MERKILPTKKQFPYFLDFMSSEESNTNPYESMVKLWEGDISVLRQKIILL